MLAEVMLHDKSIVKESRDDHGGSDYRVGAMVETKHKNQKKRETNTSSGYKLAIRPAENPVL